jgi:mxaL protein
MIERVDWRLAWRGGSEIAHGLDSSMQMAHALGADTRLVFLTDGHEAPPVHPELRMHLDSDAGQASGLIVGIGGDHPVPIPALDDDGHLTDTGRQIRSSRSTVTASAVAGARTRSRCSASIQATSSGASHRARSTSRHCMRRI